PARAAGRRCTWRWATAGRWTSPAWPSAFTRATPSTSPRRSTIRRTSPAPTRCARPRSTTSPRPRSPSAASWLAGAYGSTSVERTPSALDILASTGPAPITTALAQSRLTRVYDEDRRDHLDEVAGYGEASWRFAPGWTASAGVRAFQSALHVKSNISGAFPTVPRFVHEVSRC